MVINKFNKYFKDKYGIKNKKLKANILKQCYFKYWIKKIKSYTNKFINRIVKQVFQLVINKNKVKN